MTKHVVLFGSSANPPTGLEGHMGIVKHFAELFDEVWILPVYRHAYASKRTLEPFEQRIAMLQLSLEDCGLADRNVYVKEYEKECLYSLYPDYGKTVQPVAYGSIDLIRWLKQRFPDVEFSMIVGEDAFIDILHDKWRESASLRQSLHFEVLHREGVEFDLESTKGDWFTIHTIDTLGDVSSTKARSTSDVDELSQIVTPSVASYIEAHHLYSFHFRICWRKQSKQYMKQQAMEEYD